jgi:hypothetical protein
MEDPKLFLDMDGVFCDFEKKFQELSGGIPSIAFDTYGRSATGEPTQSKWDIIFPGGENPHRFFETLDFMFYAQFLWDSALEYCTRSGHQQTPIFLTGIFKNYSKFCIEGKKTWITTHLLQEGGTLHSIEIDLNKQLTEKDKNDYNNYLDNLLLKTKENRNDIIVIFCLPQQKGIFARNNAALIDDRREQAKNWGSHGSQFIHHLTNVTDPQLYQENLKYVNTNGNGYTKLRNSIIRNQTKRNIFSQRAVNISRKAINIMNKTPNTTRKK